MMEKGRCKRQATRLWNDLANQFLSPWGCGALSCVFIGWHSSYNMLRMILPRGHPVPRARVAVGDVHDFVFLSIGQSKRSLSIGTTRTYRGASMPPWPLPCVLALVISLKMAYKLQVSWKLNQSSVNAFCFRARVRSFFSTQFFCNGKVENWHLWAWCFLEKCREFSENVLVQLLAPSPLLRKQAPRKNRTSVRNRSGLWYAQKKNGHYRGCCCCWALYL